MRRFSSSWRLPTEEVIQSKNSLNKKDLDCLMHPQLCRPVVVSFEKCYLCQLAGVIKLLRTRQEYAANLLSGF